VTGIVDVDYVESLDQITPDNTIGDVEFVGAADLDGVKFDPRRLRRALLAAEDELSIDTSAHFSIFEGDSGTPWLVIREHGMAQRGIVLAGRVGPNDGGATSYD